MSLVIDQDFDFAILHHADARIRSPKVYSDDYI